MALFRVKPGIITVESVTVLHRTEQVIVWSICCAQKYPEVQGISTRALYLGASKSTLRVVDPEMAPTEVTICDVPDGWHTFAETGRYDVLVCTVDLAHRDAKLDAYDWIPPEEADPEQDLG